MRQMLGARALGAVEVRAASGSSETNRFCTVPLTTPLRFPSCPLLLTPGHTTDRMTGRKRRRAAAGTGQPENRRWATIVVTCWNVPSVCWGPAGGSITNQAFKPVRRDGTERVRWGVGRGWQGRGSWCHGWEVDSHVRDLDKMEDEPVRLVPPESVSAQLQ